MARSELVPTPHGRCLVLDFGDAGELDDAEEGLVADEIALAAALSPVRRRELVAGRTALRQVLGQQVPIGRDDRGAPILPEGWVGSISHKGARAAALVAPAGGGFVGIDIEHAAPPRQPIGRRILTAREQQRLRDPREVTLYFAIKEAIYKAVDPVVRRYVGFTEVELDIASDGQCAVHVVEPTRLPVVVEAWWEERDGLWLATARGRPRL